MKKKRYMIPTHMVQIAYRVIRECVFARRTGLVFIGETRYGKTTCAKAVRQYLLEEFPDIHVVLASATRRDSRAYGHAFRVILESERHVCAARTNGRKLLNNLAADVEISLKAKGGDQFVLILDEANLFDQHDMGDLLELSNLLDFRGIVMTVISFAQPEVEHLISGLHEQDKQQLIARFFRHPKYFSGCASVEMLEQLLLYLDEKSEWPDGSGWSYTEFFFPEAYCNGFRFHRYAQPIWNEMAPEANSVVSMEAIALTIEWLFLSLGRRDDEGFSLQVADIKQAIAASDLDWSN